MNFKRRPIIFASIMVLSLILALIMSHSVKVQKEQSEHTMAQISATSTPFKTIAPTPTIEPTPSVPTWKEGQYKVGVDIEAGIYMALATSHGYYAITSDANERNIIANDNFTNNAIFELKEGQYLTLNRAYAVKYENAPESFIKNGILSEGHYKVGQHIPAGEYKIRTTSKTMGYYSLCSDPNGSNILSNDNFSGERYVNLSSGQYLTLNRCELIVP